MPYLVVKTAANANKSYTLTDTCNKPRLAVKLSNGNTSYVALSQMNTTGVKVKGTNGSTYALVDKKDTYYYTVSSRETSNGVLGSTMSLNETFLMYGTMGRSFTLAIVRTVNVNLYKFSWTGPISSYLFNRTSTQIANSNSKYQGNPIIAIGTSSRSTSLLYNAYLGGTISIDNANYPPMCSSTTYSEMSMIQSGTKNCYTPAPTRTYTMKYVASAVVSTNRSYSAINNRFSFLLNSTNPVYTIYDKVVSFTSSTTYDKPSNATIQSSTVL